MDNIKDIKPILDTHMKFIKYTSDLSESIYRCPICGDSKKHHFKGHFYINNETGEYFCFKCGTKGKHIERLLLKSKRFNLSPSERQTLIKHLIYNSKKDIFNKKTLDNLSESQLNKELSKIMLQYEIEDYIENDKKLNRLQERHEKIINGIKKLSNSVKDTFGYNYLIQYLTTRLHGDKELVEYLIDNNIIFPLIIDNETRVKYLKPNKLFNTSNLQLFFNYNTLNFIDNKSLLYYQYGHYMVRNLITSKKKKNKFNKTTNKDIPKYIKYTLYDDVLMSSRSFMIMDNNINNINDVNTIVITEGVFDVLNFYRLVKDSDTFTDYILMTQEGKMLSKFLKMFLDTYKYNLDLIIYIPDKDVTYSERITLLRQIHSVVGNDILIYIGMLQDRYKDVGEIESLKDIKLIKSENYQMTNFNKLDILKKRFRK